MKSVVRQVRFLVYPMEIVSASPFRLHRRIGPRPAFPGVDATVKVVGGDPPFAEPERRSAGSCLPPFTAVRALNPDEP